MTVGGIDLPALAKSHDIISIGVLADEARRARHGTRTTFVRVAAIDASMDAAISCPVATGEIRIVGKPTSRRTALERAAAVAAVADGRPVSAFSLADLEDLAAA